MHYLSPLIFVDIIGIFAFAISGFLVGTRNGLDVLGLIIASSLTALGGGIIRDTILSVTPFAFRTLYPAVALLTVLLIAFGIKLYRFNNLERKWIFIISDTIGLVAFSITGALLAIHANYNFFGVMILSFITAVGGGVMRDILINQIPTVLTSDFYGSVSIVVAIILLLLHAGDFLNQMTILITALFAIALRLVAYHQKWHLPQLK
jgi:uncharacterized membrane protein YeiH